MEPRSVLRVSGTKATGETRLQDSPAAGCVLGHRMVQLQGAFLLKGNIFLLLRMQGS